MRVPSFSSGSRTARLATLIHEMRQPMSVCQPCRLLLPPVSLLFAAHVQAKPVSQALEAVLARPVPRILLVASNRETWKAKPRDLCLLDAWVERRVHLVYVPKGGADEARLVRLLVRPEHAALATRPSYWMLMGPDGELLHAAECFPDPEEAKALLEAHLGPTLASRLAAFLEGHPEHWPARKALLMRHREHLLKRLQERETSARETELPEALDAVLWAPLAQDLDALFRQTDWVADNFYLDAFLPRACPERHSPRMRQLYRSHRPQVIALLRDAPEDGRLWSALCRMNLVLGDFPCVLPDAEAPRPSGMPPLPLGGRERACLEAASNPEQLRQITELLARFWSFRLVPSLEDGSFDAHARQMPPRFLKLHPGRQPLDIQREGIWNGLLSPLLEGLLRTGDIDRARNLLASLAGPRAGFATQERLRALLHALGRKDLAATLRLPSEAPQDQNPDPDQDRRTLASLHHPLLYQGQQVSPTASRSLRRSLLLAGYSPLGDEDAFAACVQPSSATARALGWPPSEARWALLDASGRVIAQGRALPQAPELLEQLRNQGIRSEEARLTAFLQEHPTHLETLIRLSNLYAQQCELLAAQVGPSLEDTPLLETKTAAYIRCTLSLLEHPLGLMPGVFMPAGLGFGGGPHAEALQDQARVFLPKVEDALRRRPSDPCLWRLWTRLSGPQASPAHLLDALVPPPMETDTCAWPPADVLDIIAERFQELSEWPGLCALLMPRWERLCQEGLRAPARRPWEGGQTWKAPLTAHLVRALLEQGRGAEAESLLDQGLRSGLRTVHWEELARHARDTRQDALAEAWSRRPKEAAEPATR
jgi:hypothetical protein